VEEKRREALSKLFERINAKHGEKLRISCLIDLKKIPF